MRNRSKSRHPYFICVEISKDYSWNKQVHLTEAIFQQLFHWGRCGFCRRVGNRQPSINKPRYEQKDDDCGKCCRRFPTEGEPEKERQDDIELKFNNQTPVGTVEINPVVQIHIESDAGHPSQPDL